MSDVLKWITDKVTGTDDIFTKTKKSLRQHVSAIGPLVASLKTLSSEVTQATQKSAVGPVGLLKPAEWDDVKERAANILTKIDNNEMKISVFGRTSSGKSTVINALLGDDILPSGLGHVTNCFVTIAGTDDEHGYLISETSPEEKHDIERVLHMAHAQLTNVSDLMNLKLYLPRKKHRILANEFVIIDSPGIDVEKVLDEGISQTCGNSDVFIFVVGGESIISLTEKAFFARVAKTMSVPDIFILINRWDLCQMNDSKGFDITKLRQQHDQKCKEIFKMMNVDVPKDDRVFFVSAKRFLESRMK
ncbi:hypothetical protein DPMN_046641, partial [Dreissena polymorpha]